MDNTGGTILTSSPLILITIVFSKIHQHQSAHRGDLQLWQINFPLRWKYCASPPFNILRSCENATLQEEMYISQRHQKVTDPMCSTKDRYQEWDKDKLKRG